MLTQIDVYKVFPEGKKFARIVLVSGARSDEETRVISINSLQAENAMDISELESVLNDTDRDYILSRVEETLNRPDTPLVPKKKRPDVKDTKSIEIRITIPL